MRYVTDAQLSGLAKELRDKGVDCQTVHMALLGNEDSQVSIDDSKILKFLIDSRGAVTLITLDNGLARYCSTFGVPFIRVQDLVTERVQRPTPGSPQP